MTLHHAAPAAQEDGALALGAIQAGTLGPEKEMKEEEVEREELNDATVSAAYFRTAANSCYSL